MHWMTWSFPSHSTGGWQLEPENSFYWPLLSCLCFVPFWRVFGIPGNCKTQAEPSPALAWCLSDPRGAGAPRWRAVPPWHQQCFHTMPQPSASLAVEQNQVRSHVCTHSKIIRFPLLSFPFNEGLNSPCWHYTNKPPAGAQEGLSFTWTQKIRDGGKWLSSSWLWVAPHKAIRKTDVWLQ